MALAKARSVPRTAATIVVGAGLVGPVTAMLLAPRFGPVDVLEHRPRPGGGAGRHSLSVVLSRRGLRVLADLGLEDAVRRISVPLRGRIAHQADGVNEIQPYSRSDEAIWCVNRADLHSLILRAAEATAGVRVHHEVRVQEVDIESPAVIVDHNGASERIDCVRVIGCDGASSTVRAALHRSGRPVQVRRLDVGYLDFRMEPSPHRVLTPAYFHYWPRGSVFFGAFPRAHDGSFDGTLFMTLDGRQESFRSCRSGQEAAALVGKMFGDLVELIPDIASQYEAGTVSTISIAHSRRWVHRDKVALTGDASHAMAPFMGQGMNCGFEDARILLECLTSEDGWTQTALSRYEQLRSPDAAAIARISSEHYENLVLPPHRSLRDSARDTAKARLYSEFPLTFRPLYELCAFTDTRYGDADRHHQMTNRFVEVLLHGAGPGISEAGSTTFAAAVRAAWTTFHPDERAMAHRPPGSTDEEVLDVRRSIPHSPHGTRGC